LYSLDFGLTWSTYIDGLESILDDNYFVVLYRDLAMFEGNLYLTLKERILKLSLSDIEIEYLSATERIPSNYLFSNPPFPNPSNNQIYVKVAFDNQLKVSKNNIEIYSIDGSKVDIKGEVSLIKEDDYHTLVTWNVENTNPGIFIMQITYG